MGAIGTTLRNAIAPVARSLVSSVGRSTVQLRRAVIERNQGNGSESRSWQTVAGGSALRVPIISLSEAAAAQEWGVDQEITAVTSITDAVPVLPKDGLIVTDGDHDGTHFRVVEVRPAPMAGLQRVALQVTQERYD